MSNGSEPTMDRVAKSGVLSHPNCEALRAEVVQYIIQSEAGFYMKGVRLTAGSVQKMSHSKKGSDGTVATLGWGLCGSTGYLCALKTPGLVISCSIVTSGFQTGYIHVLEMKVSYICH